ncbi:ATP-binding protein [Streptomyces misionensis]|uniref:ATP-binding protein n=1 Tax=Streptomyces misionensis TaxID=67331 RepID=UPI0034404354
MIRINRARESMVSTTSAMLARTTDFASPRLQRTIPLQAAARPTNLARRAATDVLLAWAPERLDDIVLGVNELVVNAVQHTPGPQRLILEKHPRHIVARVCDPWPDPNRVVPRTPDAMDQGGRGLQLLNELAEQWFVQATEDGKAVCAAFLIPAQENCTQ